MHWNRREGYSLVELAVVLVIAGIILAVGAPPLMRYVNGARVRSAAHVLSDEMRLARQKAVTNSTRNWVYTTWGTNSSQYWTGVQTQTSPGVWSGINWRGPIDLPSRAKQIQPNFGGGYQYLWYDVNGRPCWSGSVKLVSTVPNVTDTVTVNVDLSGSVW